MTRRRVLVGLAVWLVAAGAAWSWWPSEVGPAMEGRVVQVTEVPCG